MLATNPRISQLAGMVKHYAPLKTKFGIDMVKLLATTSEFDALPQWLQDHLLKVEQLVEQDKANVIEKHGDHDQSSHGRRRGGNFDTSGYDKLARGSSAEFKKALADLRMYDGTPLSAKAISATGNRLKFRSLPSTAFPDEATNEADFIKLDKMMNKYLAENPVSVFVPETSLETILDEGKVKSIFEIDQSMKGKEYSEYRMAYEKVAFGYDQNLPKEIRPVYGTVIEAANNNKALDDFGNTYGNAQIVLRDDIKSRTTYTLGDSLDGVHRPTKLRESFPRTQQNFQAARASSRLDSVPDLQRMNFDYIETQIHGGIKLSDIDKIVIHYPEYIDMEATTNRLNDMGISWEVVDA